jgi:hypothetical protein
MENFFTTGSEAGLGEIYVKSWIWSNFLFSPSVTEYGDGKWFSDA